MAGIVGVLTNPNSGKNRRDPNRLRALTEAVGGYGIVRQTRTLDELPGVLEEFRALGCKYWVCDGGDGTLHWMLSTALDTSPVQGSPWPEVVPANGGSIDFVAHKVGIRGKAEHIIQTLVSHIKRGDLPPSIELDTMEITGTRRDGKDLRRIGFASAIGGVPQRFFNKLYEREKVDAWGIIDLLAKSAAGSVASTAPRRLRRLLAPKLQKFADEVFEPTRACVAVDGRKLEFESFSSLQVGSIDINLGGVVRTFRHAAKHGVLHAQAVSTSRLGLVANLPNIVLGTPIWGREVFDGPAARLRVEALGDSDLDPVIDGELCFGLSSLVIQRGPKLRVPMLRMTN